MIDPRPLTTSSAECLGCACQNVKNQAAMELLVKANASSAIGVIAALCITDGEEHQELVALARDAIGSQRDQCTPAERAQCPHAEMFTLPAMPSSTLRSSS